MLHLGDLLVSKEVKVPIMREEGCQVEGAVVRTHLVQVRVQGLQKQLVTYNYTADDLYTPTQEISSRFSANAAFQKSMVVNIEQF